VTSDTRAFTKVCCAVSTSKVVPLTDARLLADAVERDLGGLHLRLGRLDIGLRRVELAPGHHHGLAA